MFIWDRNKKCRHIVAYDIYYTCHYVGVVSYLVQVDGTLEEGEKRPAVLHSVVRLAPLDVVHDAEAAPPFIGETSGGQKAQVITPHADAWGGQNTRVTTPHKIARMEKGGVCRDRMHLQAVGCGIHGCRFQHVQSVAQEKNSNPTVTSKVGQHIERNETNNLTCTAQAFQRINIRVCMNCARGPSYRCGIPKNPSEPHDYIMPARLLRQNSVACKSSIKQNWVFGTIRVRPDRARRSHFPIPKHVSCQEDLFSPTPRRHRARKITVHHVGPLPPPPPPPTASLSMLAHKQVDLGFIHLTGSIMRSPTLRQGTGSSPGLDFQPKFPVAGTRRGKSPPVSMLITLLRPKNKQRRRPNQQQGPCIACIVTHRGGRGGVLICCLPSSFDH